MMILRSPWLWLALAFVAVLFATNGTAFEPLAWVFAFSAAMALIVDPRSRRRSSWTWWEREVPEFRDLSEWSLSQPIWRQRAMTGAAIFAVLGTSVMSRTLTPTMSKSERAIAVQAALADAGHPGAEIRSSGPSAISACQVGHLHGGGSAYDWRTEAAAGLFCAPADGREPFVIVERGARSP